MGAFAASILFGRYVPFFFALLLVALVATVILWNRGLNKIKSYFLGAVGEARVAAELRKLPDSCHVMHDFQIGYVSFVDHVVIGPTGIFSIETKDWYGEIGVREDQITRNGDIPPFRSPIKQSRDQAHKVEKVLRKKGWSGSVTPVVCFASNTFKDGKAEVGKVKIVNSNGIVELITSMENSISPEGIERVVKLTGI
jgi:hypothetical protein